MGNVNNTLTSIKLIIYKKIVPGDFKKFKAESNEADTGGGARDLRFSPANVFTPQFKRMFKGLGDKGTLKGQLHWSGFPPTDATIHMPTKSRRNEIRIGKVHQCFPEQILPEDTDDCVLLLVLDNENKVWPSFTSEESLRKNNWHAAAKIPILGGLNHNERNTPMGYVDIENGEEWNNG
jgi:hypothetical protein